MLLLLIGVWMTAFATTEAKVSRPVVSTSCGKVQGVVTNVKGTSRKVHTFRGIPFAASPTGERRFSPPQAPEPWSNVRDASVFPPVCTQAPAGIAYQMYLLKTIAPNLDTSEDCLFLNIHTPKPKKGYLNAKKPVMMWIHGGALIFGGASIYDGSALAAHEDIVVVSTQYRLGLLGFLSTGDAAAPGNWGLLDQIAALQWIKREISNFGGNPNRVTIFGESAGELSVSALMVSPMAKGLYHGAIAESGTALMPGRTNPEKQAVIQFRDSIAKATGCVCNTSAEIVACLKNKTAEELNMAVASGKVPFMPIVVDGHVLTNSPQQLMADRAINRVPMIIGYNNGDCGHWIPTLFGLGPCEKGITRAEIPQYFMHFQNMLGPLNEETAKLLNSYIGDTDDPSKIRDGILNMCTDRVFRLPAQATADCLRSNGQKAFVYEFQHRSKMSADVLPTYVKSDHGQEMAYVFGLAFLKGVVRANGSFTAEEESLSRKMMKKWANFARTGNPNSYSVQEWSAWDQSQSYQIFDVNKKSDIKIQNGQLENGNKLQSVKEAVNKDISK